MDPAFATMQQAFVDEWCGESRRSAPLIRVMFILPTHRGP